MGGGREIPIPIFTSAIVGIGTTITNAKSIVPKRKFFISLPPLSRALCSRCVFLFTVCPHVSTTQTFAILYPL
jgi:hypothetical protein